MGSGIAIPSFVITFKVVQITLFVLMIIFIAGWFFSFISAMNHSRVGSSLWTGFFRPGGIVLIIINVLVLVISFFN